MEPCPHDTVSMEFFDGKRGGQSLPEQPERPASQIIKNRSAEWDHRSLRFCCFAEIRRLCV